MYIHPDYQGVGIGSKFKKIFTKWAKDNGATKYVLGVLKDNLKARKIYEAWGGSLDKYSQSYDICGKGYDEVFYTYSLEKDNKKDLQ